MAGFNDLWGKWMYRLYMLGMIFAVVASLWSLGCNQSPGNLFVCNQASDCGSGQVCVNRTCVGTAVVGQDELRQQDLEKIAQEPSVSDGAGIEETQSDGNTTVFPEDFDPDSFSLDQDPCADKTKIKPEECNGFDDDCDGQIDNIRGSSEPLNDSCYDGLPGTVVANAPCRKGITVCKDGKWGPCTGQVLPQQETCNSLDDDCNGKIDDNIPDVGKECLVPNQVGECGKGQKFCENNQMVCRQINVPRSEECDGKDNDCDGKIDNLVRECYSGPKDTAGVGPCKKGTQTCNNGVWETTCVGEVVPEKKETCEGQVDENCDGQIDEGCVCANEKSRPCGSDVGECKQGQQVCDRGKWKDCEKAVGPTNERCDGKDNNCDGQIDEGNPDGGMACTVAGKHGICAQGKQTCTNGKLACVSNNQPQPEVCDGVDNNCDGQIDEGVTQTFYRDNDGDGYGDSNNTKQACQAPAGYVKDPGDCDDNNKNVHPGQTQYFSNARDNRSFDYNCNGKEDKEFPTRGDCNDECKGAKPGFVVVMPDCGWPGAYLTNCTKGIVGCRTTTEWRTQRCR